jgi:hypothetical protein
MFARAYRVEIPTELHFNGRLQALPQILNEGGTGK